MKLDAYLDIIENLAILAFIIVLPSQLRHTFFALSQVNGQFNEFWSISVYASDFALVFLAIIYFYRRQTLKISAFLQFLFASALILIASLILGKDLQSFPHETFHWIFALITWIKLGFVVWLAINIYQEKKQILFDSFAASGLIQAVIGLAQFILQKSIGLHRLGEQILDPSINGVAKVDLLNSKVIRAYGLFAHPNQLTAFLIVACATTLFLVIHEQQKNTRYLFIGILWILMLGEFVTFSRSGILAMALSLAIILTLSRTYAAKVTSWKLIAIVVACFLSGIFIFSPYLSARAKVFDQSNISRAEYDRVGLHIIEKHPWGVGPGQVIRAVNRELGAVENWRLQPPHNYFIIVACETGLIGAIAIAYLFIFLLHRQYKTLRSTNSESGAPMSHNIFLIGILLAFLFLMQFDHYFYTLQQTQLLLWLVVGMIIAATRSTKTITTGL